MDVPYSSLVGRESRGEVEMSERKRVRLTKREREQVAEAQRLADFYESVKGRDMWVPASGGTEEPFVTRSGLRVLYCWNPKTGDHAYVNVDTDLVLTQEEADEALCLY
jgi:hypothetical protein